VITRQVAVSASSRRDQLEGLLERAGFAVPAESATQPPLAAGLRLAGA
jgi:hypothetical protein